MILIVLLSIQIISHILYVFLFQSYIKERISSGLTPEVKSSIIQYYTCLLTHQSFFSPDLLCDIMKIPPSDHLEDSLIRFIEDDFIEKINRHTSYTGSNQSPCDVYNDCWKDFIHQILIKCSPILSLVPWKNTILLNRWYSLSSIQPANAIEQMEYSGSFFISV